MLEPQPWRRVRVNGGENEKEYIKALGAVTISTHYQAVLPRRVRELLDVATGDTLFFFEEAGRIYIAVQVLPKLITSPKATNLDEDGKESS